MRALGFGDASLIRAAARGIAAGEFERAVHEAIEANVRVIDVADEEAAERVVGDAVRTLRARERVIVACRVPADKVPPPRQLQDSIERSLRATRLDALPLAQLPVRAAWRSASTWPELRGTCARLVREGKVLQWGALVDPIGPVEDDTAELANEDWLVALQLPFSLCERGAEPVIVAARAKDRTVLARRPLAGGTLAGRFGPGVVLRPGDDRRDLDLDTIAIGIAKLAPHVAHVPPAARSSDAARELLATAGRPAHVECATVAELALRFVLDRGVVPLVRLHRREHLAEALAAASAPPLIANVPDLSSS